MFSKYCLSTEQDDMNQAYTLFSTKEMREDGGMEHILTAIKRLRSRHAYHIASYDPAGGLDNSRR